MSWLAIIYCLGAYLLGAIPFGLVLARLRSGVDLRRTGSGNIGATNVARTLGMKLGVATLIMDVAKGMVPVLLAGPVFNGWEWAGWTAALSGLAAFLGHVFSPFLGFRGGKGVATALGALLATTPLAVLPGVAVFIGVVAVTDFISAGSMAAAVALPPAAYLMGYPVSGWTPALIMSLMIIYRHRENLGRLLRGEENRWRKK